MEHICGVKYDNNNRFHDPEPYPDRRHHERQDSYMHERMDHIERKIDDIIFLKQKPPIQDTICKPVCDANNDSGTLNTTIILVFMLFILIFFIMLGVFVYILSTRNTRFPAVKMRMK